MARRRRSRLPAPLKYAATCADCGAALPVGAPARLYRRRGVQGWVAYGTLCHDRAGNRSPEFMTAEDFGFTEEQMLADMVAVGLGEDKM